MDLFKIREQLNLGIPLTKIKLRVTDYSRVSTENIKQKSSLNNQVNYFNKYIKNNPNWEYIEGYIDDGITGTSDYKRDAFMRMIEDAKNNKFDLIITKEISRFSRNTLDSIKYTRELLNYGVAVLFINDNINTALADSELRLTIMSSLAQDEIRRLSERVKFGMHQSINNGNILGNNKLLGYKKINNKFIVVKDEANIIKEIFNLYVIKDLSLNEISKKYINFSVTKLTRIIRNPKYKGYYCGRKSEVVNYISKKIKYFKEDEWVVFKDKRIPAIVNENIWNKANIKLKKNSKKIIKNKYLFSEKIFCSKDKELFHRRKQCKNDISWICSSYIKNGKNNCNNISLREKELLIIFNNLFNKISINKNNLIERLQRKYNKKINIDNTLFINKLIKEYLNKIEVESIENNVILNIYLNLKIENFEINEIINRNNKKINYLIKVLN